MLKTHFCTAFRCMWKAYRKPLRKPFGKPSRYPSRRLCLIRNRNKEQEQKEERESGNPTAPAVSLDDITAEWNSAMGQNCRPTPERQRQAAARLKDSWWRDNWRKAIAKAKASEFCNGENDRGWRADLEWFLQPDTGTKLLEGKCTNSQPEVARDRPPSPVVSIADRRRQIANGRKGSTASV